MWNGGYNYYYIFEEEGPTSVTFYKFHILSVLANWRLLQIAQVLDVYIIWLNVSKGFYMLFP